MDLRKPKELKRVSQWLALFYALEGSYTGVRGGYIFRGYATPPPLRHNTRRGSKTGAKGRGATNDRRRKVMYILTPL